MEFVRMLIPLKPGEEAPRYALDDAPDGYRWETDAELREQIKASLESVGEGIPLDSTALALYARNSQLFGSMALRSVSVEEVLERARLPEIRITVELTDGRKGGASFVPHPFGGRDQLLEDMRGALREIASKLSMSATPGPTEPPKAE